MQVGQHLIEGFSVGSVGTNIRLPSLKLAFDIGRCPEAAVHIPTVCLTHGHMDHLGAIGHHCARRELLGLAPPTYIMGPHLVDAFETLMAAYRLCDGSRLRYQLAVLSPGDRHDLGKGRFLSPFRSHHVVPCQGYAVYSTKRKVLPKYRSLTGREMLALRLSGKPFDELIETPEIAYTGDTRIDVVLEEEVVRTVKVLIMEATFVDDHVSPEQTYAAWHTHLDHIIEHAEHFQNEHLVLTHFSARYSRDEVFEAVNDRIPVSLYDRTRILLEPAGA